MYLSQYISMHFGAVIMNVDFVPMSAENSYQFLLVQSGSIVVNFTDSEEKRMLKADDILMIEPGRASSLTSYSPNVVFGIQVDPSLFSDILKPGQSFLCDSTQDVRKKYRRLSELILELCHAYYREDNRHQILSLLFSLADIMKQSFVQSSHDEQNAGERLITERIHTIRQYLQANYHQPVYLDMLADKMFLTPQYLSKFIKKHLGCTFSHYLNDIRLEHAYRELLHTDSSITDIALNNGFSNAGAFNKVFRETYGMTPSFYRNRYGQKEEESRPKLPLAEMNAIAPHTQATEIISASLQAVAPCPKPWCDTINIGPLTEAMKFSFHNSFLEYRKYLPIKYVRFTGIFSDEIIYQDEKTGEFNFTTLDEILRFFHDAGMIPHIELSYKPAGLFLDRNIPCYWERRAQPQKDFPYYQDLLRKLIRHCIIRFGLAYVSKWRFEVWLKHGEKLAYPENLDSYFSYYGTYRSIIRELAPNCSVGGPGFHMCASMTDFHNFIRQAEQKGIVFDFISLYGFIYEPQNSASRELGSEQGIIASNPSHIKDMFCNYRDWLKNTAYRDTPVWLTELGSVLSRKNYVWDTVWQATFLCHNMLQLIPHCPVAAWFSFWDKEESDSRISSGIYYPSSALIGQNGIPKPSLHGYSFLARLGRNLVSYGDNYIMTCNSLNRFQLLFYHYTHFNNSFCLHSWEHIPMEQSYELFEQEDPEHIHFTCTQFPAGRYKVVKYTLNRTYGSVLDKHLRTLETSNTTAKELLSTLLNLKDEENLYFRRTSLPRQDIFYMNCTDVLELDVTLMPHEMTFYEFSHIY